MVKSAGRALRRMILVLAVAALMAAIMMATALTAVATPNSGSAAGQCGPPEASISNPELPSSGIPGQKIKRNCAQGN